MYTFSTESGSVYKLDSGRITRISAHKVVDSRDDTCFDLPYGLPVRFEQPPTVGDPFWFTVPFDGDPRFPVRTSKVTRIYTAVYENGTVGATAVALVEAEARVHRETAMRVAALRDRFADDDFDIDEHESNDLRLARLAEIIDVEAAFRLIDAYAVNHPLL